MKATKIRFKNESDFKDFMDYEFRRDVKECWPDVEFYFNPWTLTVLIENMGEHAVEIDGICIRTMYSEEECWIVKD